MARLFTKAVGIGFLLGLLVAAVVLWHFGWRGVTNPPRSLREVDLGMAAVVAIPSLVIGWLAGTMVVFGGLFAQRRIRQRRAAARAV